MGGTRGERDEWFVKRIGSCKAAEVAVPQVFDSGSAQRADHSVIDNRTWQEDVRSGTRGCKKNWEL